MAIRYVHIIIDKNRIQIKLFTFIEDGLVELSTQNHQCSFQVRAVPLPPSVTSLLDENTSLLSIIEQAQGRDDRKASVQLNDQTLDRIRELRERLNEEFIAAKDPMWNANTVDEIWSFGPQKCGPNLLLNRIPNSIYRQRSSSIWTVVLDNQMKTNANPLLTKDDYDLSIINGFQLATAKGSLCEEPLMGVAFIVERWSVSTIVNDDNDDEQQETSDNSNPVQLTTTINAGDEIESLMETMTISSEHSSTLNTEGKPRRVIGKSQILMTRGPLTGQIISTMCDACRKAFDSQPRRLVAAMFKCEVMVNTEALGK